MSGLQLDTRSFLQVALPIMLTIVACGWIAIVSTKRHLDDIAASLDRLMQEAAPWPPSQVLK